MIVVTCVRCGYADQYSDMALCGFTPDEALRSRGWVDGVCPWCRFLYFEQLEKATSR